MTPPPPPTHTMTIIFLSGYAALKLFLMDLSKSYCAHKPLDRRWHEG